MIAAFLRRVLPKRFRPIGYLTHLTQERTGLRVRSGPFAGMHYVADSVGSAYLPKLLGIYERELALLVEKACAAKPSLILDLGAAEGYYAVGLALRNPAARVIAFEMEARGRAALAEMARLNGVGGRVQINGKCEPADLEAALAGVIAPFVVCDVEGYERLLLDPPAVPSLHGSTILVELHDFIHPGITELLKERFEPTHRIEHIWQEPRSRTEYPWRTLGTLLLPKSYLDWSVSEWRPVRMAWLWMEPRG
jgi:hypothetical protein